MIAVRTIDANFRTDGIQELSLKKGESQLRISFTKSLARFYGKIETSCSSGSKTEINTIAIPFATPLFVLKLPKFLRRLNENQDFEFWSRSTFHENWDVNIELFEPDSSQRILRIESRLRPRFAGTKYERYWPANPIEKVRYTFFKLR